MSSGNVGGGTGVYWMFYSGGDFSQVRIEHDVMIGAVIGCLALDSDRDGGCRCNDAARCR